ncbi:hypothetical protein F2Q69_00008743 [Brassica cretica]|uniref:Uncharacterized protein n=1 Tax=Brassica cretica TaxID=69181 RepID=A0A8S9PA89_BRACR|nr:hypothetical protein F2Q69_00008743 [Brassica cretica]
MVAQMVQGRRLIGASATVSGQARSNIGCDVGSVGRLDTRRWSVLLVRRNMAKKVNKMFTKPKRVEEVSLAKSGLLDEIKNETSEDGCNSGRSDLEVDQ